MNMTKEQAIQAFQEGKSVYWKTLAYRLIRDEKLNRFLIRCDATNSVDTIAFYLDGFFVDEPKPTLTPEEVKKLRCLFA